MPVMWGNQPRERASGTALEEQTRQIGMAQIVIFEEPGFRRKPDFWGLEICVFGHNEVA